GNVLSEYSAAAGTGPPADRRASRGATTDRRHTHAINGHYRFGRAARNACAAARPLDGRPRRSASTRCAAVSSSDRKRWTGDAVGSGELADVGEEPIGSAGDGQPVLEADVRHGPVEGARRRRRPGGTAGASRASRYPGGRVRRERME